MKAELPMDVVDRLREENIDYFDAIADTLEYLHNNVDDFENGDIDPEELPLTKEADMAHTTTLMQSIQFGILWERVYPDTQYRVLKDRLYAVLHQLAENHPDKLDDLQEELENLDADELSDKMDGYRP